MLRDHVDSNSLDLQTSPESSTFVSLAIEEELRYHWRNALTLVDGIPSPTLLFKQGPRRLFERFSSLMGINQYFIDPRTFLDPMDLSYQSETSHTRQMQTIWDTEYLLVMVMGMLIGSLRAKDRKTLPGTCSLPRRFVDFHRCTSEGPTGFCQLRSCAWPAFPCNGVIVNTTHISI